jgi:glycosyl transferase family 87
VSTPPERRWSWWHLTAAALVIPWLIVGIARTIQPVPHLGYDLELLGRAATRLLDGNPVYLDLTGVAFYPGNLDLYYGPPAYLIPWLTLAHVPDVVLQRLAYPLGLVQIGAAITLLVWHERRSLRPSQLAAVTIGTLGCWVVYAGVSLGASSTLTLLLIALTWFFLRRGADARAGMVLGAIIAWRVYPAAFVLPLLISRRWRAAAWAVASSAAWTVAGWVLVGQQAWQYPGLLLHLNGLDIPGTASPASLAAFLGAGGGIVTAIRIASIAIGIGLLAAGGVVMRSAQRGLPLVGWGLAAAGCLLLPGVIWDHYLTLLLVLSVGLVVATAGELPGLLPIGIWSATLGGGLALLWMPAIAAVGLRRRAAPFVPHSLLPAAMKGSEGRPPHG